MDLSFLNKVDVDCNVNLVGFGKKAYNKSARSQDCYDDDTTWVCVCDCDCHDAGVCQCADCTGNCDDCLY